MKALIIFKGTPKEAAIIKAALKHYILAIECAHIGVETVAPRPQMVDGNPLANLRIAKQLVREARE